MSEYVANLSDEELEAWYDETYQMLLLSILVQRILNNGHIYLSNRPATASENLAVATPLHRRFSSLYLNRLSCVNMLKT